MKFKFLLFITRFILLSCTSYSAIAGVINFGAANNYNAFIFNDFNATSGDVEGRLAVGGNVDISNYSVNIKGATQLYAETATYPALVTGGDLQFKSGQIAGDVHVGATYIPTSTGTVTNGATSIGGTSPIDFDSEFTNLTKLAEDLSLLTANGTAIDKWSSQYLAGAGENSLGGDLHVFNLDATDMLFTDYFLSDVDKGDTVLFNVAGDDIATSWGNFGGSDFSLKNMSDNILFNFFEAESLEINAALYGSILAPKADISASSGVIWGQVIANSWNGNAQINDNPFTDNRVSVPEPSSVFIWGVALAGLIINTRKNKSERLR